MFYVVYRSLMLKKSFRVSGFLRFSFSVVLLGDHTRSYTAEVTHLCLC